MDVLEGARDAQSRDRVGRAARDVMRQKRHAAVVARIKSRDDVQQRRLAGTVGADKADDFALPARKTDAVESFDAAERQRNIFDGQQRFDRLANNSVAHEGSRRRCCSECRRRRTIWLRTGETAAARSPRQARKAPGSARRARRFRRRSCNNFRTPETTRAGTRSGRRPRWRRRCGCGRRSPSWSGRSPSVRDRGSRVRRHGSHAPSARPQRRHRRRSARKRRTAVRRCSGPSDEPPRGFRA